ncbi:MAG: trypsin-like serine protease [Solirubrobacterales bacterium]|nr:trypsin-like serine protease [Solirubrobacterales bacterium]
MAVIATVLAVGPVITMTPADGAASDIASGFARVVGGLMSPSQNGHDFAGTPAVGALFTTTGGKLDGHFCTASVVDSPHGDLVVTAAHCMSGAAADVVFVPGYHHGVAPYGIWTVTRIYEDKAWASAGDPDDDIAFLQVGQPGSIVPIEDVTGAEQLQTGLPARQLVEVIGYPNTTSVPIACRNWTREPMSDQLEFDCGGYTDGTSGGPFLADVNPLTGQGAVIGVIGGYEQGGDLPQISYSATFGANVAALYRTAATNS